MKARTYSFKKYVTFSDLFIGFLLVIFFLSLGTIFTVNFRPLYYWDIKRLNLSARSGLSNTIIRLNYNTLIGYCSPFYHGPLNFPTLTQSTSATIHFAEVKHIFNDLFCLFLISIISLCGGLSYKFYRHQFACLKCGAIGILVLPFLFLTGFILNFDQTFTLFHKIVFRNSYWLFNPQTDPIITLLPEPFFLHCGILIILTQFLGSLFLFLAYRHLTKE